MGVGAGNAKEVGQVKEGDGRRREWGGVLSWGTWKNCQANASHSSGGSRWKGDNIKTALILNPGCWKEKNNVHV